MARNESRTVIEDDYDGKHGYWVTQHPATEGLRLFNRVFVVIAPTIGALFEALGGGTQSPLDIDIENLDWAALAKVDTGKLSRAFTLFSELVATHFTPPLFKEILKYTQRQGDKPDATALGPAAGPAPWDKLEGAGVFDRVYQGNYGELMSATWWVLRVNFGAVFTARLRRSGVALDTFKNLWTNVSSSLQAASTATPAPSPSPQVAAPA